MSIVILSAACVYLLIGFLITEFGIVQIALNEAGDSLGHGVAMVILWAPLVALSLIFVVIAQVVNFLIGEN